MALTAPPEEKQVRTENLQGPVGQSVIRADGREKVRGEPVFYGDVTLPGTLHGRVLRSRFAHARILSVDTARAKALPGVAAVVVANDVPGSNALFPVGDQPVVCGDRVKFMGDAVALVAAETAEIAARALELIDVRYEELPAVFTPQEAIQPGAPRVHEGKDNVVRHFKLRKGDVDEAFRNCDIIVENTYQTPTIEHAYLEVEGAVAHRSGEGMMTVWVPTQFTLKVRDNVAAVLKCSPDSVRVINTNAGGGFGGKEDTGFETACRAALLAHFTGRPVKLVYDREESIISSAKRHAALMHYKSGATKDGRLQAVEIKIYLNKGAYTSVGGLMPPAGGLTQRTGFHSPGPYDIPNVRVDVFNVFTHTPYSGAMRGFGSPQVAFAHEQQMDELAHRLNIDPVEIRLLNGLEAGKRTVTSQLLESSVGLKETIHRAADAARWKPFRKEKTRPASGARYRGMGVASFMFALSLGGWPEYSNATIEVDQTGQILVRTGIAELGQGSRTALAQIAAQALEIPLERVTVAKRGDSTLDPDSMLTVSSRGTLVGGNAIIAAAKQARQILLEMSAHMLGLPPDRMVRIGNEFRQIDGNGRVSLDDLLLYCFRTGRRQLGRGWWCAPKVQIDPETYQGNPFHAYAYGTQIAEVEVDTATGVIEVKRVIAAHDVGKAINPSLVTAQIEGGIVMALGFALSEEVVVEQGQVRNPSFSTYLIPTSQDVPEIVSIIVEDPYPNGPFGAKGVGEPGTVATAAAIANAVYDAIGVRLTELPMTPERVWKTLRKAEQKKQAQGAP
jgi:CO/xanthine dehydrogenase Mo-binding subunit